MAISASQVKELRDRTGAGMMECKRALVEVDGDIEAAIELMRKSGQAKADKKAGRIAAEGLIGIEVAPDGSRATMVEVNCETDFVAKEGEFKDFVSMVTARAMAEGTGEVEKLATVAVAADDAQSIDERRRDLIAKIGENISLRRVVQVASANGKIGAYLHGGRIGVLVDLNGGDDNVAKDIAMHVAASRPEAVSADDLDPKVVAKEKEILLAQVADSGKPPEIQEKMVTGRLNKYLKEVTLLGQPFVHPLLCPLDRGRPRRPPTGAALHEDQEQHCQHVEDIEPEGDEEFPP